MALKKNHPQSGTSGRYVSKEEAAADPEGTFVTETTVSRKKFKEAIALFKQSQKPSPTVVDTYRNGVHDVLKWLIHNGPKPKLK